MAGRPGPRCYGRVGTMMHLGVDPGPVETAWVLYDGPGECVIARKAYNAEAVEQIRALVTISAAQDFLIHIEMIASYGMAVGAEVFETCVWIGRLMEIQPTITDRLTRMMVKTHICHSAKANDSNIRCALIDRFGGETAIGKKKDPGPLYGLSGDMWAALAVAVTAAETTERYKAP